MRRIVATKCFLKVRTPKPPNRFTGIGFKGKVLIKIIIWKRHIHKK